MTCFGHVVEHKFLIILACIAKKELLLISALVSENGTQRQERQERFLTAIF
jgi:hypothetical protein